MSEEVIGKLNKWHEEAIIKFEIDLNEKWRKRQGVEKVLFKVPALIKEDWGYKKVDKKTVKMINNQSSTINKETMKTICLMKMLFWFTKTIKCTIYQIANYKYKKEIISSA